MKKICLILSLILLCLPLLCAAAEGLTLVPVEEAAPDETSAPEETAASEETLVPDEAVTSAVKKLLKSYNCTGAALLVAKDGKIVHEQYYGLAMRSTQAHVTKDTYFKIASVSKMVSAIGVMTLVDKGLIDLDGDISDLFGYTVRNPRYRDKVITPRMVMSHTSSFYDGGGYSSGKTSLQYLIDVKNKRTSNFTSKAPGVKYVYSNLNGGTLGAMMEAASGQSLNTYMTENVFAPLGISAAYSIKLLPDIENVSATYFKDGSIKQGPGYLMERAELYEDTCDPDKHFRTTAGGLLITAPSLMRLCMMLEQGGTADGVTILQKSTAEAMLEDQQGKPGISVSSPYGLNVNRVTNLLKGRMFYGHQGMLNNALCNVYFEPESHFCFVFISNGINNRMIDHIAGITRLVFDVCWKKWGN